MELENFCTEVKNKCEGFGFCFEVLPRKQKNAVWRKNLPKDEAEFMKGAYFGLVSADEEPSGAYSDFSLVIFPNRECSHFVIALVVGSLGFNRDYTVATLPWLRRLFSNLRDSKYTGEQFFKVDFSDIESNSPITNHMDGIEDLREVIKKYSKVLIACQIVKLDSEDEALRVVWKWLATYAEFRQVARNKQERDEISKHLPKSRELDDYSEEYIYKQLLKERFIVLQGAPGTGKTWTSNKIAKRYFDEDNGKTFFEQFHAETTYSDFIYGIRPKTQGSTLLYEEHYGILMEAIDYAESEKKAHIAYH